MGTKATVTKSGVRLGVVSGGRRAEAASKETKAPVVAQSVVLGGNVRVGLEDNIWLDKGVPASNESLVMRAKEIINRMGARTLSPEEARQKLKLKKQK